MIAQPKNRVQAIKSKFESLSNKDNALSDSSHLSKQSSLNSDIIDTVKENAVCNIQYDDKDNDSESSNESWVAKPNVSQLYTKTDAKKTLSRQISDPGKKLHRSHAFRCDRSKIVSPKRHGSCYGRPESSGFSVNMEKLPKEKLRKLSNFIEDQMRKDNFVLNNNEKIVGKVMEVKNIPLDSIPDSQVPKHILDQYAKVVKSKNNDTEKKECTTDSGVSSETEELKNVYEEEKPEEQSTVKRLTCQFESSETEELKNVFEEEMSSVKRLTCQFENSENNLHAMNDLCASSETIKLERKNPNLKLTSTLKKALKQPLPPGPPPKKPPRTFLNPPVQEHTEKEKKDAKKMLEKLEKVLQKRESNTLKSDSSTSPSVKEPKEIHYLCTEILDITHRTLLPNSVNNCLKSLNCTVTNNSTLSLPYSRLSNGSERQLLLGCSCSCDNLLNKENSNTDSKCVRCQINSQKHNEFKCHLNCKCRTELSQFYVEKEHIYDEPCLDDGAKVERKNHYGTLNHSKSLEELRTSQLDEDQKIYDIPCELSRSPTPEAVEPSARSHTPQPSETPTAALERLKSIFENPSQSGNDNLDSLKVESGLKTDFQKLKASFENKEIVNKRASLDSVKIDHGPRVSLNNGNSNKNGGNDFGFSTTKPPTKPKPMFVKNSKSSENLTESKVEKKFSTEGRRYLKEKNGERRLSLNKRDTTQLDVDRENLNQLMTEIYETVGVACKMAADTPGRFPAETADSTSEDSVKLTRSLTEKRKNYVRRVSSRVAYLDTRNVKHIRSRHQTSICSFKPDIETPYSTFRSWKSFRTSQNNLTNNKMDLDLIDSKGSPNVSLNRDDSLSIDEKTGCVDIGLPFEPRDRGLFNVCLLVGFNYMSGEAYVKTVFPATVQVPAHIENLIFPETLSSASRGDWAADAPSAQCYSLVLTDEKGERSYGYCRRVLPEGASVCLPLCYCLIGKYRAPGFYYKVLQEIESHHGRSEVEIQSILQQLFESDFPNAGEHITIKNTKTDYQKHTNTNSLNSKKCKTMPDMRKSDISEYAYKSDFDESEFVKSDFGKSEFLDKSDFVSEFCENNNDSHVYLDLERPRMKLIKRPIEPRADENNLSVLLDSLGAGLTVKIFSSLLLERKVLVCGEQLSQVSSCMEALQMALYPFVWQQPLISTIPAEIEREVLEAPLPMLAGLLLTSGRLDVNGVAFEEGMLIDLSHSSKVLFCQGDEATILPTASFKSLKTALQMEYKKDRIEDTKTRNVMISEAFLRFFVDILGEFWKYFSVGEMKEGDFGKGNIIFDKEAFIRNTTSKQNQYFLEWFTETAMFNHFVQNMAAGRHDSDSCQTSDDVTPTLVDTPLPDFYDLFNERVKSRTKSEANKLDKSNYKSAMNKRMKLLKTKLKELVA